MGLNDLLELHVDAEIQTIRNHFAQFKAFIDAWQPAPMPADWQPEPRTVRAFRQNRPWLRT
jgi:hypothetical protein